MLTRSDIIKYLDKKGFKHSLLGFGYLITAITHVSEYPDSVNMMTKRLYPYVADQHHTTASRAERAIRHSIETAYGKDNKEKPVNSEFIARAADDIKYNNE